MANKANCEQNSSSSSIPDYENIDFDELDFMSGDELDQSIHKINCSLQFSNKLQSDKGNVRLEDKQMLTMLQNDTNWSVYFDSCSARCWSDKSICSSDLSSDENDQVIDGAYNKFAFARKINSDEPLLTIIEESCESEISF